jgi:amino acid adenylation domain-containing protein
MNLKGTLDLFPLTPMQQGMLYQWRLSQVSGINLEQLVVDLPERIELSSLETAWRKTIARFDALRTRIHFNHVSEPAQEVLADAPLHFTFDDWRNKKRQTQDTDLEDFLQQDRERGFDLSEAPLMRVHLFQLGASQFRMVWTFHHIILDGRSFPIVLKDLFDFYEAEISGSELNLEPSPGFKPYVDYLSQSDTEKAKAYWQHLLDGVAEQELPFPHEDPSKSQHLECDQNELEAVLKPADVERLQQFADHCEVTLHSLLQAVWGLTLSAYTGQTDVVFGTIRACRHLPIEGIDQMAGMLINTLPFRAQLKEDQRLVDWLHGLRQQQMDARPFEETSLHKIRDWIGLPPSSQLINTMLMFDYRFLGSVLKKQGGKWEKREFTLHEKTEFHLGLSAYLDGDLVLRLEFDSSVYELDVCEDMLGYVVFLLENLPDYEQKLLREIPTMPEKLESNILEIMSPQQDHLTGCGLHHLVEEQVRRDPDVVALRSPSSSYTYLQLNEAANRWAHMLIENGVKPGDILGVSMARNNQLVIVLLGILKAGAAYCPLDPKFPMQRLEWMLEDTQPRFVIAEAEPMSKLPVKGMATITVEDVDGLEAFSSEDPEFELAPESPAMVIFTSGSTGRPKGVLLQHRALLNHCQATQRIYQVDVGDVVPKMSTINFDVSIEELFTTLASGATLVMPPQEARESITNFLRFIESEGITMLNLTTLYWQEVVHHLVRINGRFPASVRLIVVGGERTTHSAFNEFLKVGGEHISWINAYGPTETSPIATAFQPQDVSLKRPLQFDPPIGRPIDNVRCYVLDGIGRLLPPGVPGELFIGGEGVSLGYLKRPELTRERFLPDPFNPKPNSLMYKSGDRVRLSHDDGQLEYLDRLDNQIKMRGFRIELGEVEAVLNRSPLIQEGLVLPVKTAAGNQQLVAYVVSPEGSKLDVAPLKKFLKENLPPFMRPSVCVPLDAFPKTPSGKINRRNLPVPELEMKNADAEAAEPENETQAKILKIWREVLKLPHIGLQDNFFELGGDSLKAMTLSSRIEEGFNRSIPLALLINAPTVEMYAAAIETDIEAEGFAPMICIKEGKGQPLFLIHSLGGDILIYMKLAKQMKVENPIYGIQMRGLDRKQTPHHDLATCAADFIQLVKEVQPEGPYAMAGYSSGGLIAFEMANQLKVAGEEVAFLGLIDSAIPPKAERLQKPSKSRYMANFLRNLPAWAADISSWKPTRVLRAINRKVKKVAVKPKPQTVHSELKQVSGFRLEDHFEADMSFFPAYRIELIRIHFEAIASYHPQISQGNACIFRSKRQPLFSPQNKYLGWNQLIKGDLKVQMVTGNHAEMLEEPNVTYLAEKLIKHWQNFSHAVKRI